jgi:hypothetical protein
MKSQPTAWSMIIIRAAVGISAVLAIGALAGGTRKWWWCSKQFRTSSPEGGRAERRAYCCWKAEIGRNAAPAMGCETESR